MKKTKYFLSYYQWSGSIPEGYFLKNKIITVHPLKWVEKTSLLINWWKKLDEEDEI